MVSPNYPEEIRADMFCTYRINVTENHVILVEFETFKVSVCKISVVAIAIQFNCRFSDRVQVWLSSGH